jgi:putative tricarboxylic transport membrane protein
LQIHNVNPGPMLFLDHPNIFWGFVAAMYISDFLLLVLNLPLVGLFARVASLRAQILMPIVGIFCLIGCYTIRMSLFDVWIMIAAGIAGFFLNRIGFSMVPLVIGLVLGDILEDNLRVTMQLMNGDISNLWDHPIALCILTIIPLYVIFIRFTGRRVLKVEVA